MLKNAVNALSDVLLDVLVLDRDDMGRAEDSEHQCTAVGAV
jgi:hypothetical protein